MVHRVGIIGAGQLGMMLGEAGRSLDAECRFLDPSDSPPAAVVGDVLQYPFDDAAGLQALADSADALTYEFENVPVHALEALGAAVQPPLAALACAQDRAREKSLFEQLDIPVGGWRKVDSEADVDAAARELGLPLVLKTRRFGYDGKGQMIIREHAEIANALEQMPRRELVAEAFVPFEREVSAIGARRANGETRFYPLTENVHRGGILHTSIAPAGPAELAAEANRLLQRLLDHLDYVGVLALEYFVVDGRLLANEFAPRVHNSGHWTIEGAATSQFENHLRAVLDLPLGDTDVVQPAGMLNLIGAMPPAGTSFGELGGVLHDYGKTPRAGRKLGHVTVTAADAVTRDRRLAQLTAMLGSD